jgi:hypothetical protein
VFESGIRRNRGSTGIGRNRFYGTSVDGISAENSVSTGTAFSPALKWKTMSTASAERCFTEQCFTGIGGKTVPFTGGTVFYASAEQCFTEQCFTGIGETVFYGTRFYGHRRKQCFTEQCFTGIRGTSVYGTVFYGHRRK